ncbi:hypothetical protein [Actinoplanes regularis]|nr:hypothetical protein [Actinoplanes regularis]
MTSGYVFAPSGSPVSRIRVRASTYVIAVSMGSVTSVSNRPSR